MRNAECGARNVHSPFPIPNSAFGQGGQALVELAIFGSLIIFLMGALVNFGLSADFSQQATMRAFRQGMASAAISQKAGKPTSVSHVVVEDRHIPNPGNPFGFGSVNPVIAQASVIRNAKLQETADIGRELPRLEMDIQGQHISLKVAGFREEEGIGGIKWDDRRKKYINDSDRVGTIDRYEEVYGAANVAITGADSVRIIDSCEGEMMDHDSCVRQSRQIVSTSFCQRECVRGRPVIPDDPSQQQPPSCEEICAQPMHVPWYAEGSARQGGRLVFPNLEALFNGQRALGLQPGSVKETRLQNTLTKEEGGAGITTTETLDWQDQTDRTIMKVEKVHPGDHHRTRGVLASETVTTQACEGGKCQDGTQQTTTQTTPWRSDEDQ